MTAERLAAIRTMLDDTERARERLHGLMGPSDRPRAPVLQAALDLLAEVERLRARLQTAEAVIETAGEADVAAAASRGRLEAENAAAMEIVQFVAGCDIGPYSRRLLMCEYDDADIYVAKARALVAERVVGEGEG